MNMMIAIAIESTLAVIILAVIFRAWWVQR